MVAADPGGGARVLDGDTVTLTLSLGELLVPKVRGLTEDAAQDALLDKQLEFGESTERWSEKVPAGTVIGSDPRPGTELEPGAVVDLVVSKGREPIPVGIWIGESLERAQRVLEKRGLVVEVVDRRYDDEVPEGDVIAQNPEIGTLNRGQTVELVVSDGPELVEVPRTYLFGVEAAEEAMRDAGFEVEFEDAEDGFGLGFVSGSDPGFGEMAPKGSTITLFVV